MTFSESRGREPRLERTRLHRGTRGDGPPRSGAKLLSLVIVLTVSAAAGACIPDHPDPTADTSRPSIVLVALDTVRADHLSPYASPGMPAATPVLQQFARDAMVYERARTPAPLTMPAMAAVMTGRYPHAVGIAGHSRDDRLAAGADTLAAIARRAGYRTAAVVTNPWLAHPGGGFPRDFETFVSGRTVGRPRTRMGADEVVDEAIRILASADTRPTLLWVHFLDAHMPYTDGEVKTRVMEDFKRSAELRSRIIFEAPYPAAELDATRNAYASAIARIDTALGRLFDSLPSNAIVVILADHGESLGEHGLHFAHDFSLYDELLHVPLIVRAPGVTPGRDPSAVSLIDVLPTICALAKLDCSAKIDGRRLPHTGGDDPSPGSPQRTLYAATTPARARYRCPWLLVPGVEGRLTMALSAQRKLVRMPTPSGPVYRAYDLIEDPAETVDLFDVNRDRALVTDLDAWSAAAEPAIVPAAAEKLSKPLTRELRELGYLD